MSLENPWIYGAVVGFSLITFLMTWAAFATWWERKFSARLQTRRGPNRVGPFGLLQPIADAVKMMQKENIVPDKADRVLFELAPVLPVILILATAAVIPFGVVTGTTLNVQIIDMDIGVLWVLAVAGLMVFPLWMAGWASNNKYALLSGMRSVAQGVSYEIPMILSALVPVIAAGSFSLTDIVAWQQEHGWLALGGMPVIGFVAFVLFFLTSLAEANRIPFDIPEAESELVAGLLVEYTGIKFGIFMLAEYLHTVVASALAAAMFLGGAQGPGPDGVHWMLLKTAVLFFIIYWVRWSWFRFRADQLMKMCWVYFVPLSLLLVMGASLWIFFTEVA